MEKIVELWNWLTANGDNIAYTLLSLIVVAETVVRFTPTEKDDGAVQRVGGWIKAVLDFLKLPNAKK